MVGLVAQQRSVGTAMPAGRGLSNLIHGFPSPGGSGSPVLTFPGSGGGGPPFMSGGSAAPPIEYWPNGTDRRMKIHGVAFNCPLESPESFIQSKRCRAKWYKGPDRLELVIACELDSTGKRFHEKQLVIRPAGLAHGRGLVLVRRLLSPIVPVSTMGRGPRGTTA